MNRLDPATAARIAERTSLSWCGHWKSGWKPESLFHNIWPRSRAEPLTGFQVHFVGLNPAREELYRRIDDRVVRMFENGLDEEVRTLLANGIPPSVKPFEAIGYRHVIADLDSCIPREETIRIIQRDTRRYAKRQMTWFRKQSDVRWFDGPGDSDEIKEKVYQFLETACKFLGSSYGKQDTFPEYSRRLPQHRSARQSSSHQFF